MRTRHRLCTQYKSLYSTNSGNQEATIGAIAGNEISTTNAAAAETLPIIPGVVAIRRRFQPRLDRLEELIEALCELLTDGVDASGRAGGGLDQNR
jgi:hypothetical protein